MYSAISIGVAKKKSFRSKHIKRAPLCASEIVLLRSILVSKSDAAGDPVLFEYESLSPPTTTRTRHGLLLRGL